MSDATELAPAMATLVDSRTSEALTLLEQDQHPQFVGEKTVLYEKMRKSKSLLDHCGIRLEYITGEETDTPTSKHFFVCLVGGCGSDTHGSGSNRILVQKTSTGAGTRHLSGSHSLTSRKTKSAADTVASLNAIVKGAAPGYQENSERFLASSAATTKQ